MATTVVTLAAACTGSAGDPPPNETTGAPPSATAGKPDRRTVEELASTAPVDLIVDLGPDGWTARYNGGAGIAVSPENWAEAYEISADGAAAEIAAARRDGQQAAATEQWRFEPTGRTSGYSTMRLTIRRYTSLARIKDAWWAQAVERGFTPGGIRVPSGMRMGCAKAELAESDHYAGAHYAGCTVIIGDTTVVYLSRVAPTADAAETGAVDSTVQWLRGVKAPVD